MAQQQIAQMQQQMGAMMEQITRILAENEQLKKEVADNMMPAMQKQMTDAMTTIARKLESMGKSKTTLMDVKGLGRPGMFNNTHEAWLKWSRSMENFVVGIFGEDMGNMIEHAAESETEVTKKDVDDIFGENARRRADRRGRV